MEIETPTVYTGGTFDLFHRGHLNFLKRCSEIGEVIVALNTDEFVESYKGFPPVMTFDERRSVLEGCRYVSRVIPNLEGGDSRPTILSVAPDYIVIGSDWARRDYYSQMGFDQDWLDSQGIGLCYVPYTHGISSTEVKDRLRKLSEDGPF